MNRAFNFKSLDLFGVSIPISYENNYLYKTNVGAVLTIISFLIIITYALFQISTLLDRSSYTIISSETQDLRGKIDLSNTPIMFTLLDLERNPVDYDQELFKFNAIYIEDTFQAINGEKKRITNTKNLEIERCDKLKKEFKALNEFSEYNLTKYMCIKPNQSLILLGTISDIRNDLKSLEVKVSKLNKNLNESSNFDITSNLIENRIFSLTYLGYTTNFTNSNNNKNVEYKIYTSYIYLSKYLRKKLVYIFSKSKLNLFDSFFVTYKTEINYFFKQDSHQDFTFIGDNSSYSDELVRFDIIYGGRLTEYTKNIKGIGPTFTYIMATFNTVIILSRIINDYYGNKILLSDLFHFLKIKNTNSHNINKYRSSKDVELSKNEFITKIPINNNFRIDEKGKLIVNVKNRSSRCIKSSPYIKFVDKQKITHYKYSKKDHWKFCFYPYCLVNKNQKLYSIKDEICSIFSVENVIETIKSLKSVYSLRNELYNKATENKIITNNFPKIRESNDCESKSKIEIVKFSEVMNDK